jgi:prepilin-type processing-associated H-X9-DG protein
MEAGNSYNAINLSISSNMINNGAQFTSFNTVFTSWLCPSDGTNGGGRLPINTPTGQWCDAPIDPSTGTTAAMTPIANYAGSFGDNYCGGPLCAPGLTWETPYSATPAPGQPRIGWNGYWGTFFGLPGGFTANAGTMRGYFDYRSTQKPPSIASITDGTSNTIMAGEVMPSAAADSNFWYFNGSYAGTTVPLGWNANTYPATAANCLSQWQNSTAPNGCRYSAAGKGFVSLHPGGSNFAFGDGSVRFLKNSISMITYCALGSRAGGEVVSSDSY